MERISKYFTRNFISTAVCFFYYLVIISCPLFRYSPTLYQYGKEGSIADITASNTKF
jgi:hypothetical protein